MYNRHIHILRCYSTQEAELIGFWKAEEVHSNLVLMLIQGEKHPSDNNWLSQERENSSPRATETRKQVLRLFPWQRSGLVGEIGKLH